MPLSNGELSLIQLARIERTEIRSIKSHQDETDAQELATQDKARKKLARLEKRFERERKKDPSKEPDSEIAKLKEQIEVTERRVRARQSARVVSNFVENTRDHVPPPAKPKTLLDGVQESIEYARSGKMKRAAFEQYLIKKRKEGEAASVASLNLKDEVLAEFREAFAKFDGDNSGSISAGELGKVMRMLGDNPSVVEVAALAHQMDSDGSGEIEFGEFVEMMAIKKGYCAPGTTLSAADLASVENSGPEGEAAAAAKVEKRKRQAALAAATAKNDAAREAAAAEEAMAEEVATWAGGTVVALKPAPIYPTLVVENKTLIAGNCRRGAEYSVLDAGHADGWLRVRLPDGWVSVYNNRGDPLLELSGEAKQRMLAGEEAAAVAAAAAEAAAREPGPLKIFIHRPFADCADTRIDGLWPHVTVRELHLRVHHAMGLHPLSQKLTYPSGSEGKPLDMADDRAPHTRLCRPVAWTRPVDTRPVDTRLRLLPAVASVWMVCACGPS